MFKPDTRIPSFRKPARSLGAIVKLRHKNRSRHLRKHEKSFRNTPERQKSRSCFRRGARLFKRRPHAFEGKRLHSRITWQASAPYRFRRHFNACDFERVSLGFRREIRQIKKPAKHKLAGFRKHKKYYSERFAAQLLTPKMRVWSSPANSSPLTNW